jgi:uncharacterized protein YndB with AHSA1/START domain
MTRRSLSIAFLALAAASAADLARADTSGVSTAGFTVTFTREVNATPDKLWTALTQVQNWWNSAHSWSGKAANMSFDLQAGGCWCEKWEGSSVMHGTVVSIQPRKVLRFYANLGPLQERATNGVLTFAQSVSKENNEKTVLKVTYRVAGPPDTGLQELAPAVDGVIGEQVKRLVAFAETGKAE